MRRPVTAALAVVRPAAVARSRKNVALLLAGAADLAQAVFFPLFVEGAASPFELGLDVVTAIAILLVVGFKWRLAIALATELVPGADLFPTWTAVVLSLPVLPPASPAVPSALPPSPPPDLPV
jgi:hypothetical protein